MVVTVADVGATTLNVDYLIKETIYYKSGFPHTISKSTGMLGLPSKKNKDNAGTLKDKVEWNFDWPKDIKDSEALMTAEIRSIRKLDTILNAMDALIRQPHGCFEQTSSTTYPMVMALTILKNMQAGLKGADLAKVDA